MRIYLDEKCRECKGKRARLIQVVERGSNVGAATYEDCSRCSGVGLEPRELTVVGAIDHDTDDFLDYRKHPEWAELQNDELVYRMEEKE